MGTLNKTLVGLGTVIVVSALASTEPDNSQPFKSETEKIETIQTIQQNIVTPLPEIQKHVPKTIQKTIQVQPIGSITNQCHPSYSGCLKQNAGDYDCRGGSGNGPNYTGRVQVLGYDEFDLDRDNDGWGCE